MTIKWVKVDPLVMNGEPFCYGSRLTVRQVLELRQNGYTLVDLLKDHPELKPVGVAEAFAYAAADRDATRRSSRRTASLGGPGYTADEAATLPERLRIPGIVIKGTPLPPDHRRRRPPRTDDPGPQLGTARPPVGRPLRAVRRRGSGTVAHLDRARRERRAHRAVLGARQLDRPRDGRGVDRPPSNTCTTSNSTKVCGGSSTWWLVTWIS